MTYGQVTASRDGDGNPVLNFHCDSVVLSVPLERVTLMEPLLKILNLLSKRHEALLLGLIFSNSPFKAELKCADAETYLAELQIIGPAAHAVREAQRKQAEERRR